MVDWNAIDRTANHRRPPSRGTPLRYARGGMPYRRLNARGKPDRPPRPGRSAASARQERRRRPSRAADLSARRSRDAPASVALPFESLRPDTPRATRRHHAIDTDHSAESPPYAADERMTVVREAGFTT
nr:hypothetical protein [Burkholderia ambifaria]